MRQSCFVKVEPDLATRCAVEPVDPAGCFPLKDVQHLGEAGSAFLVLGRMGDEMVVVGEDRLRLKPPAKFSGDFQQSSLEHAQAIHAPEMVLFSVGARRDEVGAGYGEPMGRRMGPRQTFAGHAESVVFRGSLFKIGSLLREKLKAALHAALQNVCAEFKSSSELQAEFPPPYSLAFRIAS